MYAVEKKYEIEMKLKKEMTNIQEIKAAASRSSSLANDVCNVLGACEHKLQQLDPSVLPYYSSTTRLQQILGNMEKTSNALDQVINYYMVARELADLIQAGPHAASMESLNAYLQALDKLAEAQQYFNKNELESVELTNINQLYNTGVTKLEKAFEDLLSRNTRPLTPTAIKDLIALEEDSSNDSASAAGGSSFSVPIIADSEANEGLRAAAAWLCEAGRPPANPLMALRGPALKSSMTAFRDYLRTSSMGTSPLPKRKTHNLNRTDSTKKSTRLMKVWGKASNTLEATGLPIIPRRPTANDSHSEDSSVDAELEAEQCCELVGALCALACREQRFLLGLVPLSLLPALLENVLKDALAVLTQHTENASSRWRRLAARCSAAGGCGWAVVAKMQQASRHNSAPPGIAARAHQLTHQCVRTLSDWVDGIRNCNLPAPADGTVHELGVAALAYLHSLQPHAATIGPALSSDPSYQRAASQLSGIHDRNMVMLAIYMRKVLAQLNLALRSKSEQYTDALKAIFLLNNTLYLLQGLQRTGILEVLSLAEPQCEMNYRDMIREHQTAYLNSWNKLISSTVVDETIPPKLRDKDRQILKDKFASFNRELEECTKTQRCYSVPDPELREKLKMDNKEAILPPYTRLYDTYGSLPFSKNPDKYVKYSPVQVAAQLDGYFDEAA